MSRCERYNGSIVVLSTTRPKPPWSYATLQGSYLQEVSQDGFQLRVSLHVVDVVLLQVLLKRNFGKALKSAKSGKPRQIRILFWEKMGLRTLCVSWEGAMRGYLSCVCHGKVQ